MEDKDSDIFQLTEKDGRQENEPKEVSPRNENSIKINILVARIITTIVLLLTWIIRLVPIAINTSQWFVSNARGSNNLTNSLISSTANLSNVSLDCPSMYIFESDQGLCEPRCGEWGGCGDELFKAETWLLRIMSIVFLLVSSYTLITWLLVAGACRRFNYIPTYIMLLLGVLFSLCFCYWDLPGVYTSYCLQRDSSWYSVLDTYSYASVLLLLTHLTYFCLILWLGISLLNLDLRLYLPYSKKMNSTVLSRGLITAEIAIGLLVVAVWGVILHVTGKGYDSPDFISSPPRDANKLGILVSETLFSLMNGCVNTLCILIVHHIRISIILRRGQDRKEATLLELDKRLVSMCIGYIVLTVLESVLYLVDSRVSVSREERVTEYASCITGNATGATDVLLASSCSEPCLLAIRPAVIRAKWMALFVITSLHSTVQCWRLRRQNRCCCDT